MKFKVHLESSELSGVLLPPKSFRIPVYCEYQVNVIRFRRAVLPAKVVRNRSHAIRVTIMSISSVAPRVVIKRREQITALPLYYYGDLQMKREREKVTEANA